jgi:hypothetical protein
MREKVDPLIKEAGGSLKSRQPQNCIQKHQILKSPITQKIETGNINAENQYQGLENKTRRS